MRGPKTGGPQSTIQEQGKQLTEARRLQKEIARLYRSGRADKAIQPAEKTLEIIRGLYGPHHLETSRALNDLGGILMASGKLAIARLYLERAVEVEKNILPPDDHRRAAALSNLATVRLFMGDPRNARPLFEEVLAMEREFYGEKSPRILSTLGNLGIALVRVGDLDGAEDSLNEALEISEKEFGRGHFNTILPLTNLGGFLIDRGDLVGARRYLERAWDSCRSYCEPGHPKRAMVRANLGGVYFELGQLTVARDHFRAAWEIREAVQGVENPETQGAMRNLASAYESLGERDKAFQLLARALESEEAYRSSLLLSGSESEKTLALLTLDHSDDTAITFHVGSDPDDFSSLELAFNTVLRHKGRSLDAAVQGYERVREQLGPEERRLLDRHAELRKRLATPQGVGAGQSRRAEIRRVEDSLSSRSEAVRRIVNRATWQQIQRLIPPRSALIELVMYRPTRMKPGRRADRYGPPKYAAFVLKSSGRPRFCELGPVREVDRTVADLRQSISGRRSNFKNHARRLDAAILEKIKPFLKEVNALLIAPDGELNLIPFAVFVDEKDRFLIERYRLSYLTGGREILHFGAAIRGRGPALVIGDVDFDSGTGPSDVEEARRSPEMSSLRFLGLPGAGLEARIIADLLAPFGARLLTGPEANEGTIKAVSSPAILHFATHGFFLNDLEEDFARPADFPFHHSLTADQLEAPLLQSGLALAGFNRRHDAKNADDGFLTALEVAKLDLRGTEFVVLSACETGLGKVRTGLGVFGLRRALVLAGSKSQVMTLWQVDDESTRRFMVSWYEQMVRGVSASDAIQSVQFSALKGEPLPVTGQMLRGATRVRPNGKVNRAHDARHPFYWAGFILSGEAGKLSLARANKPRPD